MGIDAFKDAREKRFVKRGSLREVQCNDVAKLGSNPTLVKDHIVTDEGTSVQLPLEQVACFAGASGKQETRARCVDPVKT